MCMDTSDFPGLIKDYDLSVMNLIVTLFNIQLEIPAISG